MHRPFLLAALSVGLLVAGGCYQGGERDKEAPPGYPGGFCLPAETCYEPNWHCNPDGLYCFNVQDPCEGVFCGGHGECQVDPKNGLPVCACEFGYSNEMYSLYCLQSVP